MERLGRLTCLVAAVAAVGAGCSGTTETGAEESEPTACGGSITTEPSVVAVLPGASGLVLAQGTTAYVLGHDGTVTAVDLCSQTTTPLASFAALGAGVIAGDALLLAVQHTAEVLGAFELVRLPLDGGDIEALATVTRGTALDSNGTRTVVSVQTPISAGGVDLALFELTGNELVQFGQATLPPSQLGPTGGFALLGVSELGAYARVVDAHGPTQANLYTFDGFVYPLAKHTAGALDVAVWGDRLFVAADTDWVTGKDTGIRSLSLTGGDPQVLLEPEAGHTRAVRNIVVDEQSLCWLDGTQATTGAAAAERPRCMPQGGGEVRVMGEALGPTDAVVNMQLTDGVLVWTVANQEGTKLMAAIP